MWSMLHAVWRLTVAIGISWIAGKLTGWLALTETIVCSTPQHWGQRKRECMCLCVCVCVCVCVCSADTVWSSSPYLHNPEKG